MFGHTRTRVGHRDHQTVAVIDSDRYLRGFQRRQMRVRRDVQRNTALGGQRRLRNQLLLVFGLLGLMMRRFGLPVLPLIIGVILGPRIERQLRQALQLGGGDWTSLFTEAVAIVVYVLMVVLLLTPLVLRLMHRTEEALLVVEDDKDQKEKAAQA